MKNEKNILIAFILNLSFSIFEFFGGLFTNSIAIISDAIHDMGDALSIGISYILEKKSHQKPDEEYTYGYVRYSSLGAIITNTILLVGSTLVIINALKRIINPVQVNYNGMMLFAIFGVITNFLAVYFTKKRRIFKSKSSKLTHVRRRTRMDNSINRFHYHKVYIYYYNRSYYVHISINLYID